MKPHICMDDGGAQEEEVYISDMRDIKQDCLMTRNDSTLFVIWCLCFDEKDISCGYPIFNANFAYQNLSLLES